MYSISNEQVEWLWSSPACRGVMEAGEAHCPLGKLILVLAGKDSLKEIGYGPVGEILYLPPTIIPVVNGINKALKSQGVSYATIDNINSSNVGSFQENHYRALKMLLSTLQGANFLVIEDNIAKEFSVASKIVNEDF